jgi:hypothetical protein
LILELKKLDKKRQEIVDIRGFTHWNRVLWSQTQYHPKEFKLGDYVLWFLKDERSI